MLYDFKYKMDGLEVYDRVCCAPEEFSEIEEDIDRNGGTDFELISMKPDDGVLFKIQLSCGWTHMDYVSGMTEQEAIDFCEQSGWKFIDENGFEWDMDYVEDW